MTIVTTYWVKFKPGFQRESGITKWLGSDFSRITRESDQVNLIDPTVLKSTSKSEQVEAGQGL